MKNQKKNYFSVILSFILLITGSIFLSLPKQNIVNADTVYTPSYLTVYKNNVISGDPVTYERTGSFVQRNDAVFLNSDQVLILRLAHPDEQTSNAIITYNFQVFVNNNSLTGTESYIQPRPGEEFAYIDMVLDLYKENPNPEGKYDITISYMEYTNVEGSWTNALTRELSYSFYLYKTSTYYSGGMPAVSVTNATTYLAGTSSSYSRTHEFNYNNNLQSSQRLNLPVIAYDINKFELSITKTISGATTTSKITVDANGNLVQTNEIVKLHKVNNTAYVTFNDIGTYYVQYLFIYNNDGTVEYFANINSETRPDRVNLFGFQIYHADINSTISSARKEFKVFNEDNTLNINHQTDITYTQIDELVNLTTPDGTQYTVSNENIENIDFNTATLTVPSTNQAPVDFNFNASIVKSKSFYLRLDKYDTETSKNIWTKTEYNGTSFTDVGTYLVKITYSSSISTQTKNYTQWFYFKITNETPSFKISNSQNQEVNSNTFTKDTISVQFEQLQNPFDSASALSVYSKSYSQSTYSNGVTIPYNEIRQFSSNGNYRVVLQFGKNLTKSKVSYFTIDNTEITGFNARNIVLSSGYNIKTSAVSFFTNQNVSVEWNEKQASGNTITAEYKFIPIIANTHNFSSTELQSYYEQGYYIPTSYSFDYEKGENGYPVLKTVPYTNTLSQTTNVSTEGIFTQQGIYIFHLVDKAGNEKYGAFVIDKTAPVVLQKMTESGNYVTDFSSLNLIADDSIIQWGKYKAIKTNLDLDGIDFTNWTMIEDGSDVVMDSWLLAILRNKARSSQQNDANSDFKVVTVNTSRNLYLTPRINTSAVEIQIGQTRTLANLTNYGGGALIDEFSYAISVAKTIGGNLVLYENTYSFFVSDESKTNAGFSTTHSIQVSTDISKTSVRFATTVNQKTIYDSLVKHSYEVVDTDNSVKSMYFMPINYNVLQLQYLISPTENAIEVDQILVYYYPYISNYLIYRGSNSMLKTNMYYTLDELITYTGLTNETVGLVNGNQYTLEYLISKNIFVYSNFTVGTSFVLSKQARLYTVFDYASNTNLGIFSNNGMYVWDLNTITNTSTKEIQTQQGKYEIIRTYRKELSGVEDIVGQRYDFMTRTITFIVDREDIVSSPVTLNITAAPNGTPNYVLLSQVGGASYIEVLAGSGNSENIFTELFRARNYDSSSGSLTNILETNKLPVKISIPLFKFGQVINDNFLAFSNNLFYTSSLDSFINSFEMLITVKHLPSGATQSNSYTVRLSTTPDGENYTLLDNGLYLITTNVTNGYIVLPNFTQVGQYEIKISQNNATLKGNKSTLTFYMNIINVSPEFDVEDIYGNVLELDLSTQTYYTNKNTLRVAWTDSTNVFNAKIDLNNLKYFDGTQTKTVPVSQVTTLSNGYSHYFDINISNYSDGTGITVILSYEGDASAYPPDSFSKSKIVRIDRIAPTSSIDKLIAKADEPTIINSTNLRQGHNQAVGYNKTTTTQDSIYKNFAFAVDIADFNTLIYSSTDKTHIYYRPVPTKYTDASYVELDPSSETALTQLLYSGLYTAITQASDYANLETEMYYEIAEKDFAGNITVYSIYLTNVAGLLSSESNLKNDNENYKDTLDDTLKFVSYSTQINDNTFVTVLDISENNNAYKVYAKNNFTLQNVNAYGYAWAVITYNNIKYLQSPKLDGTVYRISASGTTEVSLNTIALALSRYNYPITIKNMPKANVSLSIVVSANELTISQPTGTNETLSITRVKANDTEYVNWNTVEIYEFRNGTNVRYTKFVSGTTSPVEGFNLATYTTTQNITTFTINALVGSHYRYKITDNLGKVYTLHHLYGQEYVTPIINNDNLSSPLIVYEDEMSYYLSDTGFTYTFFPSITTVKLTMYLYDTSTSVPYVKETKVYTINELTSPSVGVPYFTISPYSSYTSIIMSPEKLFTVRFEGVKILYTIEATTNILNEDEDNLTETETNNFMVYSLVPTTQLKGKNRQNLNDLILNSTNLTSEPITVEFIDSSSYDYPVEFYVSYDNQNAVLINSGTTYSAAGTYRIIKRYTLAMSVFEIVEQSFTISDSQNQFYTVVVYSQSEGKYVEISPTGSPYLTADSGTGTTIYEHYIVNTLDFKINVNSSQYVEIVGTPGSEAEDETEYYTSIKRGISTYIRTISNFHANESGATINYVRTQIAISYIPLTNKIASSFYYTDSQGNQVNLTYSEKTYILEKDVDTATSVIVNWNNYYMISENKIVAEIRYGSDNQLIDTSKIVNKNGVSSISLTRSGYYQFMFRDLAGNTHKFDYNAQIQNSTNTYDFIFLKNVIFTVNEKSPIPYAIYNSSVQITIPSYTLNYYDSNARPQIVVEKNGVAFTGYTSSSIERKYTFTEPGLYKVIFQAKRGQKQIKEEAYYFEIIKSNEVANAFSIEEYEDYYIEKITKDGTDVTRQLSTTDLGKLIYVTKDGQALPYLKNLFVSLYDEQTGAGIWEITVNTNNDLSQTFTYSFRINSVVPPISVSIEEGGRTTNVITVNFNVRNLYDEVGDSVIKIGNQQIVLNEEYFNENSQEVYSVEITTVGDTYIQILTPSGRLLYTYRVTREQPLNTVAIIVIVVSSLAAVGLVVMFVLLRRRMRIR